MFCGIFSDEFISRMLKLAGTTEWMGTHIDLTLGRPRAELVLIIERVLTGKPLKEEGYEYIPIDSFEPVEPTPYYTPKGERYLMLPF